MNRLAIYIFSSIVILLLSACNDSVKTNYQELGWKDLKPYEEQVAEQNSYWGSLEVIENWDAYNYTQGQTLEDVYSAAPPNAYSVGVVSEIDGKNVRVPGFVVPIEFEEGNLVTEFFLVPYFGACFHKPPPPPNQTIFVTSAEPIEYESIYDPVWIMGAIKTQQTGNDIATAAYSMNLDSIETYEE